MAMSVILHRAMAHGLTKSKGPGGCMLSILSAILFYFFVHLATSRKNCSSDRPENFTRDVSLNKEVSNKGVISNHNHI